MSAVEQRPRAPPILNLPEELYDEILSHIGSPYHARSSTRISNYWEEELVDGPAGAYDCVRRIFRDLERFPWHLQQIRLACRALHRAATRALFDQCFTIFYPVKTNDVQSMEDLVQGTGRLSTIAPFIRRLRLNMTSWADNERIDGGTGFASRQAPEEETNALRRAFEVLPQAIARLPLVQCIQVYMPSLWVHDYRGEYEEYELERRLKPDIALVEGFRRSLASVLNSLDLENLTDLRLALPCAYDFVAIGEALSDEKCARLKHLYLQYIDATGYGGSREYLIYAEEDDDYDDDVPFSTLQEKYSNYDHMQSVCDLVNRCHNLESLGLVGTNCLQLDLLDWHPAPERELKTLHLHRARISCEALIRVLSPNGAPELNTRLFSVWLEWVELKSETWKDIFEHLLKYPSLACFCPKELGYSRDGSSAHLREWNSKPQEYYADIWTENDEDRDTLKLLTKKLEERAGGADNYPSELFDNVWSGEL